MPLCYYLVQLFIFRSKLIDGGYAIVAAMDNKEQLQSLNLNGNQFGEEARDGIRELLEESNRLQALQEMDEDDSDPEDEDEEECDEVGVS